jgi:hypothetical protein
MQVVEIQRLLHRAIIPSIFWTADVAGYAFLRSAANCTVILLGLDGRTLRLTPMAAGPKRKNGAPFVVRDCALVAMATGQRAQTLKELRDGIAAAGTESLYYHFWGHLLRPRFDDPEYHNDFAVWLHRALHDDLLAERMAIIDPADFDSAEALRAVDERLDELEYGAWARHDEQFHFRRCQTVVFDTGLRLRTPRDLAAAAGSFSPGSIFYHVIDARRREPLKMDDLRAWLGQLGPACRGICEDLAAIDPYFSNLVDLRRQITETLARHFPDVKPG